MVPAPGTPLGGERPRLWADAAVGGMDVGGPAVAQADVPMAAAGGQRLFCPVPGCPCADGARARGWASAGSQDAC